MSRVSSRGPQLSVHHVKVIVASEERDETLTVDRDRRIFRNTKTKPHFSPVIISVVEQALQEMNGKAKGQLPIANTEVVSDTPKANERERKRPSGLAKSTRWRIDLFYGELVALPRR